MVKEIIPGKVFKSENFGYFKIIQKIDLVIGYKGKEPYYEIEFVNTGYRTLATSNSIRHGRVKDKYVPTIANIGYIGDYFGNITSSEALILYRTWNDMLNRCYNPSDKDYPLYGGIGISVNLRWHCFMNFYIDAKQLSNYDKKAIYPSQYQLDKDYLQFNIPKSQRIYSKETCMWLSKADNFMIANRERTNGYYGVVYRDNRYHTIIGGIKYASFKTPEAAACMFNYLYPLMTYEFNNIQILNDVKPMTLEELIQAMI